MTMDRAALVARAKSLATPVVSCVAARIRPDHLIRDASRDELLALVIVLAEAADPVRLRLVTEAVEDGRDFTERDVLLRKAHSRVNALQASGQPVPLKLGVLESEYQAGVRARRGADSGGRYAA